MLYVKTSSGSANLYPYTLTDLRRDYPSTSFPTTISDECAAEFGVYQVVQITPPEIDYSKNCVRTAVEKNGIWIEVWSITDATQEEITERLSTQWETIRRHRNDKLSSCDWTQLPDCPLTNTKQTEWATYRQALRDITNQSNPFAIIWPVQPE